MHARLHVAESLSDRLTVTGFSKRFCRSHLSFTAKFPLLYNKRHDSTAYTTPNTITKFVVQLQRNGVCSQGRIPSCASPIDRKSSQPRLHSCTNVYISTVPYVRQLSVYRIYSSSVAYTWARDPPSSNSLGIYLVLPR